MGKEIQYTSPKDSEDDSKNVIHLFEALKNTEDKNPLQNKIEASKLELIESILSNYANNVWPITKNEIDFFDKWHHKYDSFTPENGDLVEETEKGVTDQITRCSMWQWKKISQNPKLTNIDKTIFTFGLWWCLAVFLVTEDNKGKRDVIMSHFPPTNFEQQKNTMRNLVNKLWTWSQIKEFFAITPEWWDKVNWKYVSKPDYLDTINKIHSDIESKIWSTKKIVKTYSWLTTLWWKDEWFVKVDLPSDLNDPIRFQIWPHDFWQIGNKK